MKQKFDLGMRSGPTTNLPSFNPLRSISVPKCKITRIDEP